jgi:hypothetical protein
MGWPNGVAQQSNRDTRWESRVDGHPGGCPTESGRAPVGGGRVPDGGRMGARRRVGLGGWPDGGVYKSGWPTFLGTLLQRPVLPTRNAGAQGANE